jgi:type I restriction enzyme S subunit
MATSQDFVNWVCSDRIDFRYLKYILLAEHESFLSFASGTTHQTIYFPEVKAFHVLLPPVETQRTIASVLSTFDHLIENNLRRIELLEQMARTIYKEWFVNFRYPGHEQSTLVDSSVGPIPEGWGAGALDDLLVLQRGFDLPLKSRRPGSVPVIAATGQLGTHEVARVSGPGVVTGRSGSLGTVTYVAGDFWPLNTTLWVKEFRLATPELAAYVLRDLDLAQFNSGAAVPTLNRNDIAGRPIAVPPVELVGLFSTVARRLLDMTVPLERSSDILKTSRDLILPRLISGQIDVSSLDFETIEDSVA